MINKPKYDNDYIYKICDTITTLLNDIDYKIDYMNNRIKISFNIGYNNLIDIDLLCVNDDNYIDDFIDCMYDSNIMMCIYRNEQIISQINCAFEFVVYNTITNLIQTIIECD